MIYRKPCVVCGEPLERPHPSQLARVSAHNHCKGRLVSLRAAARREDRLAQRWAKYPPAFREELARTYSLGAQHQRERIRMRLRMRAIAARRRATTEAA